MKQKAFFLIFEAYCIIKANKEIFIGKLESNFNLKKIQMQDS